MSVVIIQIKVVQNCHSELCFSSLCFLVQFIKKLYIYNCVPLSATVLKGNFPSQEQYESIVTFYVKQWFKEGKKSTGT